MKKLLLFTFALFLWTGAWAQEFAAPTTNPTEPTDVPARVSVIFSNHYGRDLTSPNNGWGGGPDPKFTSWNYYEIQDGHKAVHVVGTAINGRATVKLNSDYSILHVALYPKTATSCKIWDDNTYGSATTYTPLIPGQWNYVAVEGVSFSTDYIGIELYNGEYAETEFYMDHFYFAKPPVVDTTPPTLSVCSLKSTNCVSATLRLQATDNLSETVYYKITNTANSTVWQTSGANDAEIEYVVGGLSADTEYNFSVVAMDENENSSDPQLINATTSDYPAIPVPNKKEADVKTLYGYYGSATGLNKTSGTDFEMLGKTVVKYKNNNAQFSLPADPEFDASDMDYIHFDILSDVDTPTALFVENRTENWKGKDVDGGLAAGEWTSFDVPVSFFITECGQTMTRVINLALIKAVSNKSGHDGFNDFSSPYPTLYIANAYLWKASEDIDPSTIKSVTVTAASTSIAEDKTTQLTVTDQSSRDVTSLMTFASSRTDVATVSAEGIVTAINPGTARITATVTGYGVSSYIDITVTEAPLGFDLTADNHTIHVTPYHIAGTTTYKLVITSETETLTGMGGSFWHVKGNDATNTQMNTEQAMTVNNGVITVTGTFESAPVVYTPLYVMMPGQVTYTTGIENVDLDWIDVQKVTIGPAEWASFSSTNALDFGKVEGLKAYYATANDGLNISYNTVEKAPAGTGLILGGEQGNYDVPVIDAAPALSSTNLLQSTAAGDYTILEADENLVYVFGKIGSDIGFVKGNVGYVIGANKAYLRLTKELAAKGFNFIGLPGSETDGINKVNTLVETGVRYNLAGQRVGNDYKGIVIVNGRKVVIK